MRAKDHFVFGMSVTPLWFRRKVLAKEVDYEYGQSGRIESCRFYSLHGQERQIFVGDLVSYWELYKNDEFLHD